MAEIFCQRGLVARLSNANGRHNEAAASYERAATLRRRALGDSAPLVAAVVNELGSVLEQSDPAAAEARYREAVAIVRGNPGARLDYAQYLSNLGYLLSTLGRYSEAEQYLREGKSLRDAAHHNPHWDLVKSRANLARLFEMAGRVDEALNYYHQAYDLALDVRGPQDGETIGFAEAIARLEHAA